MKIGILVSSIGNFGKQGFYNSQEVGLAKALNHFFEEVKIYKLVQKNQEKQEVKMEGCRCTSILYLPAKNWGINGIVDTKELDPGLNVLLYFSDTQILFRGYIGGQKNIRFDFCLISE